MLILRTQRIVNRLQQLVSEIQNACNFGLDYHDRLREFKLFCDKTPVISQLLLLLPDETYDFDVDWRDIPDIWRSGENGYAMRWNAIAQMVEGGATKVEDAWISLGSGSQGEGLNKITELFVIPLCHFLIDQLSQDSAILYTILRYKRYIEWFEAPHLRNQYRDADQNGENILDENLRKFLFESGIDYPFSQPVSPQGKVDVVAGLETNDPLVLEIKVWDSSKGYKENRIHDGLRQVIEYATKYGKDKGHIIVFNLDPQPLVFIGEQNRGEWPSSLEYGGRTYYFIDIHLAERPKPISQFDKGKPVETHEIKLVSLLG
jgi:hypothetical protein